MNAPSAKNNIKRCERFSQKPFFQIPHLCARSRRRQVRSMSRGRQRRRSRNERLIGAGLVCRQHSIDGIKGSGRKRRARQSLTQSCTRIEKVTGSPIFLPSSHDLPVDRRQRLGGVRRRGCSSSPPNVTAQRPRAPEHGQHRTTCRGVRWSATLIS